MAVKKKKSVKVKWESLENEYISTRISYKKLAEKHKISERNVARYAKEHHWQQKRHDFVSDLSVEIRNTIIQNETTAVVGKLQDIATAADRLSGYILKAVEDEKQLYKRSFYDTDKGKVIEYETTKIDGTALNQLVRSLDKLTDIIRDVNQIADDRRQKADVTAEIILPEELTDYGS